MNSTQKTLQQIEQDSLDEVVSRGLTRRTLQAAFNRVSNKVNWKFAIDAKLAAADLTEEDVDAIKVAITFYTGSVAHVTQRDGFYHVVAAGYYRTVGA